MATPGKQLRNRKFKPSLVSSSGMSSWFLKALEKVSDRVARPLAAFGVQRLTFGAAAAAQPPGPEIVGQLIMMMTRIGWIMMHRAAQSQVGCYSC